MPDPELVLVTGATGAQGGTVAKHLLRSGKFAVRGLTRNPDSDQARALAQLGAQVVQGDLADRASLERALEGADGCFGVTNFWEHFGKEAKHGRNLVDAVAASGVQHFVFSTLPSAKKITGGALEVPHLDIKAELEAYARELALPASFVHVAFYYENFLGFFPAAEAGGRQLHVRLPAGRHAAGCGLGRGRGRRRGSDLRAPGGIPEPDRRHRRRRFAPARSTRRS